MKITTADEFVKTKVLPEFRPIVELLRKLMRELAPDAQEVISYGIPVYKKNRSLAVIGPNQKRHHVCFLAGRRSNRLMSTGGTTSSSSWTF